MYIIQELLINCIVLQEDSFKIKLISNMIYKQVVQFKVINREKIKYSVNPKEKYCTNCSFKKWKMMEHLSNYRYYFSDTCIKFWLLSQVRNDQIFKLQWTQRVDNPIKLQRCQSGGSHHGQEGRRTVHSLGTWSRRLPFCYRKSTQIP